MRDARLVIIKMGPWSLRLDLAQQLHCPRIADHPHAQAGVGRVATLEQKDRITECRHRGDPPATHAPLDDILQSSS